jgi:RNA polymerase sigma-70 factor, ECF subfamily
VDEFEAWYQEERPRVLAACVALAGDLDAARDATDEAFTRALERWNRVAKMVAPGAWTQTVALNYLRRRLRRQRREPRIAAAERSFLPGLDVPDRDLWSAVRMLPRRQQSAVVLRFVHDLSYEQIGATMSISAGAVSSTLSAARASLAHMLSDSEISEETVDG